MVVRGTRASLARARNIRSARRSRSSRILSKSSSKSTSSSKTNSTSNTQSTSKNKQIAMYEEVQKTADELQKTAKTLMGLGAAATTDTAETTENAAAADSTTSTESATTTDNTTAEKTTTQTDAKTEEERKKEIIEGVKDLVEQYNTMYKDLGKLGGTVNTLYASQLKSLLGNEKTALEKTGVVMNKDGTLSITAKTLESTDLNTLQEVYCKSGSITEKLMDKGEKIESNASATISVMNRMYGTSTYNKYGSSSSYYGSSGSWYNAIG